MKDVVRRTCLAATLLATPLVLSTSSHAFDSAPLHTIQSQIYRLTFSGKVRFSGAIDTGTEVRARVMPQNGKTVEAIAKVDVDGHFTLTLSFESYPNEPLDWTLTAKSGHLASTVVEGRQILSEEPTLSIQKSIELTEAECVSALG
jgi:hypothetical protein